MLGFAALAAGAVRRLGPVKKPGRWYEAGATHVSAALFLRWQEGFGRAGRQTWAARLGIVRLFAGWLHGLDPGHEVPPAGLIPSRSRRPRPPAGCRAARE